MIKKNNGKLSEKLFFSQLKEVMDDNNLFVVGRFVDTHDARNFLPPAPSDYYITYAGVPWLVEVKSSVDPVRFPLKNISPSQLGFSKRYVHAGWKSIFPIHRVELDIWYFLPFEFVWKQMKSGKSSFKWEDLDVFRRELEFEFWIEAIV